MGAIPPVHIIVKNGHVTLEGVVISQMDKNMAGIYANTVPGVFSVQNNLALAKCAFLSFVSAGPNFGPAE